MNTIDAVASLVILVVLAALAWLACERTWPSDKAAKELGYMPDSETPECGWLWPIVGAIGVAVVVFAGLFGYVGSAVFL